MFQTKDSVKEGFLRNPDGFLRLLAKKDEFEINGR